MTPEQLQDYLKELDACEGAMKWCEGKTLQQSWNECKNPEWMFWFLEYSEAEVTDKQLRLIAVKCARQVQHLLKDWAAAWDAQCNIIREFIPEINIKVTV